LVRILWFVLIGGWGRRRIQARLEQDCDPGRQDRDPGKQKLKGAVRTETYRCHYCQQEPYYISYSIRSMGRKMKWEESGGRVRVVVEKDQQESHPIQRQRQ
jgi:hypothetical protein